MPAHFPKHAVADSLRVYCQLPMLCVFILGIASGFPLLLTSSTLAARMTESGVNIQTIGLFALVGLPYTLKFLCAPLVDALHLPKIRTHTAHRKSWCVLTQILLVGALAAMAICNPAQQTWLLGIFALMTAAFSAMQDIVIDALRIELLPKDAQGAAAAASVAGYRIGMLLAGAGAFVLASFLPWRAVYLTAACIMAAFIPATLLIRRLRGMEEAVALGQYRPGAPPKNQSPSKNWLYNAIVAPIVDFMARPRATMTILFIALFKLGDAMAGTLAVPFYLAMGFSKIEIAAIQKLIGVLAVLLGTFIGGIIVKRAAMKNALLICGTLQLLSNFAFVALTYAGYSIPALTLCICIENISGGMGTAAFVAFMAQLCNIQFTATQYALLSSISSIGRTLVASSSGWIQAALGWDGFFIATAVFALPGMLLIFPIFKAPTPQTPQSPS